MTCPEYFKISKCYQQRINQMSAAKNTILPISRSHYKTKTD